MHHQDTLIARNKFVAIDCALVGFALIAALCSSDKLPLNPSELLSARLTVPNLFRATAVFAAWAVLMRRFRTYSTEIMPAWSEALRIGAAVLATSVPLYFSFDHTHKGASALSLSAEFAIFCFVCLCGFRAATALLAGHSGPALLGRRRAVIIGTGPRAMRMFRHLRTQLHRSHTLLGFFDTVDKSICAGEIASLYRGPISHLEAFLIEQVVDEVYVALPARSCYQGIEETVEVCSRIGIPVKYPDDTFPSAPSTRRPHQPGAYPRVVTLRSTAHDERLLLKRLFDVVFSLLAIVLLSPLLLAIAVLIKCTSRGPVLFFQERYGLGRRRFRICKFRSMFDGAEAMLTELESLNEADGPIFKMRNDPRVTKVGSFLRRMSIDELPQLFNVFAGHMSFVGPRPMSVRDVSLFTDAWLMRRFTVKPGITGLWQVTGRSSTSFNRWIELDLQYIDNWSLGLDARILAQTLPAVLKGTGAM